MSTQDTNKAKELANQIRSQLADVTVKVAELSNMGFNTKLNMEGDTFEFIATKEVWISL